ncbi:MAG: outer membrane lipoprotein chaperone LolA [Porticoccaceae bacterium]
MFRILFACLLTFTCSQLWAGGLPGANELRLRLEDMTSLAADFQQTLYAAEGDVLQQASGHMLAARPNQVRWETEAPLEQLIVSDGKTLWLYDPDLEQVTIKPFEEDLSKTPAVLFIGDLADLEDSYAVTMEEGETTLFTLLPNYAGNLYEKVTLEFRDKTPLGMALWDSLGQKTDIRFDHMQRNPDWKAGQFQFIPPEGVDIIGTQQ